MFSSFAHNLECKPKGITRLEREIRAIYHGERDIEPYTMERDIEPYTMERDIEPYTMEREIEPYTMEREIEPYTMERDIEPYTMERDIEPYTMERDRSYISWSIKDIYNDLFPYLLYNFWKWIQNGT